MSTLEDIERAVAQLAPPDLDRFSAWFERWKAERFDAVLADDAAAGRLDALADAALADLAAGRVRDL